MKDEEILKELWEWGFYKAYDRFKALLKEAENSAKSPCAQTNETMKGEEV